MQLSFGESPPSRKDVLGPVKKTILPEFEESQNSYYRSPKKAMLASLLLPGLGQVYVGGAANWIRASLYFTSEIALFWGVYQSHINLTNAESKFNRAYSNSFSHIELDQNLEEIFKQISNINTRTELQESISGYRSEYCQALYGDNQRYLNGCMDTGGQKFDEHQALQKLAPNVEDVDALMYLASQMESVIGWSDYQLSSLEEKRMGNWGSSVLQNAYRSTQADIQTFDSQRTLYLGLMLANHILSAIDAAIAANYHNKNLYKTYSTRLKILNLPTKSFTFEVSWVF